MHRGWIVLVLVLCLLCIVDIGSGGAWHEVPKEACNTDIEAARKFESELQLFKHRKELVKSLFCNHKFLSTNAKELILKTMIRTDRAEKLLAIALHAFGYELASNEHRLGTMLIEMFLARRSSNLIASLAGQRYPSLELPPPLVCSIVTALADHSDFTRVSDRLDFGCFGRRIELFCKAFPKTNLAEAIPARVGNTELGKVLADSNWMPVLLHPDLHEIALPNQVSQWRSLDMFLAASSFMVREWSGEPDARVVAKKIAELLSQSFDRLENAFIYGAIEKAYRPFYILLKHYKEELDEAQRIRLLKWASKMSPSILVHMLAVMRIQQITRKRHVNGTNTLLIELYNHMDLELIPPCSSTKVGQPTDIVFNFPETILNIMGQQKMVPNGDLFMVIRAILLWKFGIPFDGCQASLEVDIYAADPPDGLMLEDIPGFAAVFLDRFCQLQNMHPSASLRLSGHSTDAPSTIMLFKQ